MDERESGQIILLAMRTHTHIQTNIFKKLLQTLLYYKIKLFLLLLSLTKAKTYNLINKQ